jgi:ribosomal protein S18 acetylase RimI-like enzyme
VDDRPELLRTVVGTPVAFTNATHAARLAPQDVDEEIRATMALLERHGVPGSWIVTPLSRPPGLGDALLRHGWRLDDPDFPWMTADLEAVLSQLPPPPDGLLIAPVEDDAAQGRWLAAMTEGFGLEPEVRDAMSRLSSAVGYGPDRPWRRFVGSIGGRTVGTAGLMVAAGLAGVYNVATPPDLRKRGIATAMTAAVLREARARGYRFATLGASRLGYPVYEAMGFEVRGRFGFYTFDPRPTGDHPKG